MKANTTKPIVAIMVLATLVSAISFLRVATMEVPVFADRGGDSDHDYEIKQANKCNTKIKIDDSSKVYTGGASSSSAAAENEHLASTSAAAAPGTGIVCNTNAEISNTDND
jgi:hypothetical protein